METQNYIIIYSSGVRGTFKCKSLRAAKMMATKNLTHGNSVTILDDKGNAICVRNFRQSLNSFGWDKWQNISDLQN